MKLNSKRKTQHSTLPAYAGFVRWAFTRLYREFAWTYDAVAAVVSGGQWSTWTLAALPYLRGRVLELGCGTGNLQRALAMRRQHAAVGLDRSRQMLALTQRKLAQHGLASYLTQASAAAMPFPDASFDTLVATFPSEYIVAPETLANMRRVLRPDGRLVVILGARFRHGSLYHRIVDLLYRVTLQRPILIAEPAPPPQSPVGECLTRTGFHVHEFWQPIDDTNADVLVILAER